MSDPAWPIAERPAAHTVRRRTELALAAEKNDATTVISALGDEQDRVRASAIGAAARLGVLSPDHITAASTDVSHRVRRAVAQLGATDDRVELDALLVDDDPTVIEVACWAAGERESADHLTSLCRIAETHQDALCREAAVAALGAVGDEGGLDAILAATTDKPAVRRRAMLALAPFSGERVEAALRRGLEDRDWQTRQAAEDLLRT